MSSRRQPRRILIYSHDTFGIGNIRRTLEICWAFSGRMPDASILVLTGSSQVDGFRRPPNVDYIKLPEIKRIGRGQYEPRATGFKQGDLRRMRSEICTSAMLRFAPDLVLVDKAPLGVDGELRPAVEQLAQVKPSCQRVLALRDILDEPAWIRSAWQRDGTLGDIEDHYDAIWVFGNPGLFDLAAEYELPASLRERLVYMGFLGRSEQLRPPMEVRQELGLGELPFILVTAGGGDDGDRLLTQYAAAMPLIRQREPAAASVIVVGPQASHRSRELIAAVCAEQPRSRCLDFTPDIVSLMNAASCVVCMGGYNTTCEVLMLGKPALMVPRTEPVREQILRARLLADRGAVRCAEPGQLDPAALARDVLLLLNGWQPQPLDPAVFSFAGHKRAARLAEQMLAHGRDPRFPPGQDGSSQAVTRAGNGAGDARSRRQRETWS